MQPGGTHRVGADPAQPGVFERHTDRRYSDVA